MKAFQISRDAESYRLPLTWRLDSIYHFVVSVWVKRGTEGRWFAKAHSMKKYKLKDKFWHNGEPMPKLQITLGRLARLTSPCGPLPPL